jgi:hypothetical protein
MDTTIFMSKVEIEFLQGYLYHEFQSLLMLVYHHKAFLKKSCFLFGVGLNPMNLLEYAFTECTIGRHQMPFFFHVVLLKLSNDLQN